MNKFLITFDSTHQVLKAEKALKGKTKSVTTIPTPEKLSSDCGVSLQVSDSMDQKKLIELIKKENLGYNNLIKE